MFKLVAAVLLIGVLVAGAGVASHPAAAAAQLVGGRTCPGPAVASFERHFPQQVRRFGFDGGMLEPFVKLWRSGRRPDLPVSPETVTVYALPGKPYVVGYERKGCLIAFLAVPRQNLWKWLRPRVGWPA